MAKADLIRKAQQGDTVAMARLLQMHYLTVKRYLITVTYDRALAEDLTQETMIRAIQRIGQFRRQSRFSTWLIAIATNLYMDFLRKEKRERRLAEQQAGDLRLQAARPDPGADWADLLQRLQSLPRDVSLPVVLKHYYGYTYEEIAEWMGIPVGTVKSRIFNGVRSLRKGLETDESE